MSSALYFAPGASSARSVAWSVGSQALRVELPDAAPLELPCAQLETELGGTQQRYLVCRWLRGDEKHELFLERGGLLQRLEREGAPHDFVTRVRSLVSTHQQRWVKTRAALLVVSLLLLSGVGLLLANLHELAVAAVPVSMEEQLGQAAALQLNDSPPADPRLQAFAEQLVARLAATRPDQPYRFQVEVRDDPQVNAFAAPGGYVVVYTGLIAAAERPEEVAGVLAHELAHVLRRHTIRTLVTRLGVAALIGMLFDPSAELANLQALLSLADLTYSRAHEADADAVGVTLLHDAGIDPAPLADFFDRLAQDELSVPALLSTHPASDARRDTLAGLAAELPARRYEPLDVDWEALRALAR